MDENTKKLAASSLVVAFYSAIEPRPAFLGKERRKDQVEPTGLDLRNPSISPGEVFDVYTRFLRMLEKEGKQ